jgi:hypothetical protein
VKIGQAFLNDRQDFICGFFSDVLISSRIFSTSIVSLYISRVFAWGKAEYRCGIICPWFPWGSFIIKNYIIDYEGRDVRVEKNLAVTLLL